MSQLRHAGGHGSAYSGAPSQRQVQLIGQVVYPYPSLPYSMLSVRVGGKEERIPVTTVRSGYRIEKKCEALGCSKVPSVD
jgi:hypothetical protein